MPTVVAGYSDLAKVRKFAADFAGDHKVIVIGPTDRVEFDIDDKAGRSWDGSFYVVIATQDEVAR